jgi:hypothetical protein
MRGKQHSQLWVACPPSLLASCSCCTGAPIVVLQHLLERMREHLEVTLAQAQTASDEDILDVHPSIVRRRVLR